MGSEVSLVCVGTPSAPNGSLSTTYLERVAEQIGAALAERGGRHTVVFRSTMLPGTCLNLLVPILEKYVGGTAGVDFGVAVNPEFLREGTSVRDFFDPPKTVIGELDPASGDVVAALYDGLPGEVFRVPIPTAEMIKYADNAFHGLKIGFANELGAVCQALGVDSHQVMDVFLADRKLNISPAYLRPGFAFGGSCLPKDLRGLVHAARRADVSVPMLAHVLPSNDDHLQRAVDLVERTGKRRVGPVRAVLQARHRRPPREPAGRAGRAALRQGLRPADLRRQREPVPADRREPRVHREPAAAPRRAARATPSTRCSSTPRCASSADQGPGRAVGAAPRRRHRSIIDLVRLPDAETRRAEPGTWALPGDATGRPVGPARADPRREPVGAVRPAGVAGVHDAARRGLGRCTSSVPQGTKRDTEPEAEIDGVRIHRYPLRAATGGPPATCGSTDRRCGTRSGWPARSARSTWSTPATRPTCCSCRRCG